MVKKIISLMLVVCMLLTFIVSVSADASESAITAVISEVAQDGTFSVTFYVTPNAEAELQGYTIKVNFDKNQIAVDSDWKIKNVFGELYGDIKQYNNKSDSFVSAVWACTSGMINGDEEKVTADATGNIPLCVFKLKVVEDEANYGNEATLTYSVDTALLSNGNAKIENVSASGSFEMPDNRPKMEGLSFEDKEVVYNGEAVAYPVVTGAPAGAVTKYTVDGVENAEIKDAGTYKVVATTTCAGYKKSVSEATVTVKKAPVTLNINNAAKMYGDEDPEFYATVDGLIYGDRLNFALTRETGEERGQYQITANLGENANYDVTVVPGTLTIQKPEIYAVATKGVDNSQVYLDVFIKENIAPVDKNANYVIEQDEISGISGYKLAISYDEEIYTIKNIKRGTDYNYDVFVPNKDKATVVWTSSSGLITETDENGDYIPVKGLEDAHLLRYTFNINLDNISEADYGTLTSFAIDATSDVDAYNGRIYINSAPAEYTIPEFTYTYQFVNDDGQIIKSVTAKHGSIIETPEAPTKASTAQYTYTFKEWEGYTDGMILTEDVTFKAVFDETINQYTYKFLNEDGTVLKETVADYGSIIEAPEAPTKASTVQYSYTFKEWKGFTEGMTLTGDITFIATFDATLNKYTYTFYDEDGVTELKKETVDYGTMITPPETPTKPSTVQYSYTFKEWEGYADGMTLTGDVTFKAVFDETINQYTYKFLNEDGTVLKETVADYGSVIEAPQTPEKAADDKYTYVFVEWEGYADGMTLVKDVTFTAIYDAQIRQNIELSKVGAIVVGESFTQNINFATLKSANCIVCEIIYPDILELNAITPKEFEYATKDSLRTIDGYNYLTVTCQYRYDDVMIPQNTSVNPFELSFTVSKTAKPQEIEIRFGEDTYLLGDEEYQFDNKINTKIGIRPKLAEYVMLTGAEEIFEPTKYNAEVYPDYTTDKEIVWTVNDETVATISKDGVLTPVKNGEVTITATAVGGARMSKTVKVHKKAYVDSFKSDIGIWKEKIAQDTKEYTILVPAGTKAIKITPFFSTGSLKYNDTVLLKNRAKEFVLTADETILTLERSATEFDDCTYTIKIIRKPGLKNETVDAENFKEDCVNMLVYNNSVVHVDEKEDVTVTMPEATKNYKVLYWESLASLKPAAAPVEKTF